MFSSRLKSWWLLSVAFPIAFSSGSAAQSSTDPDLQKGLSAYREAMLIIKKAEDLRAAGKREDALALYEDLVQKLEFFKRNNPRWNNFVTLRHIELCRSRIAELDSGTTEKVAKTRPSEVEKKESGEEGGDGTPHHRRTEERREEATASDRPTSSRVSRDNRAAIGHSRPSPSRFETSGYPARTGVLSSDQAASRMVSGSDGSDIARQRARILLSQGMYESAAEDFWKIIATGGGDLDSYYSLGTAYEKWAESLDAAGKEKEASERYRDAIAAFKQAIWLNHAYAPAYYSMGCIYARLKMRDDALHYFRKAIENSEAGSDLARRAAHNVQLLGGY